MSPLFQCEIPGRVGIKKNGRKIIMVAGWPKSVPSDRYCGWERMAKIQLKQLGLAGGPPIRCPLYAEFVFHFKDHKSEADVSNCIEGPQDLLQELKIIENDNQIVKLAAEKIFDKTEKTVIRLFKLQTNGETK